MRRLLILVGLCLTLSARAAVPLIDGVDARRVDGHIDLEFTLGAPFRYLTHTLDEGGRVLRIQLQPLDGKAPATFGGGPMRFDAAALDGVPLDRVEVDLSGTKLLLSLTFADPVVVSGVRSGGDTRNLIVAVAAPAALSAVPGKPAAGIYVVNLRSGGAQVGADVLAEAQRAVRDAGDVRLYQELSRAGEAVRYRLRCGFFADADSAKRFADTLRDRFPEAWVGEVSELERERVLAGQGLIDPATILVNPERDKRLPAVSLERLSGLLDEGEDSVRAGQLSRAATIYARVAAYPVSPLREYAQEHLGVVQEKAGHLQQARKTYEAYLQRFPDSEGAARVRQRLAALLAALQPQGRAEVARRPVRDEGAPSRWDVFGGIGQFYRRDELSVDGADQQVARSALNNDLYLNARRRGPAGEFQLRLSGSFDRDFLNQGDDESRVSAAYLEYSTAGRRHDLRLGRQSVSGSGVLGRFDGLYYGLRPTPRLQFNALAGLPVELSSDGLNSDRRVYGLSMNFGPWLQRWNLALYGLDQQVNGATDSRSVGSELRYFANGRSLFGLVDYDLEFGEVNVLYLVGSQPLGAATSLNVSADRRRSPLLSLRNALIGQGTDDFSALQARYSPAELQQLALDRSPISTSFTLGLSHQLSPRWQFSGDVSSSSLSEAPASGGVEAFPASGPDWYGNLQLVANDLWRQQDVAIFGLRQTLADSYDGQSLNLSYRTPFGRARLNPRLRVDYRQLSSGETQWIFAPDLRFNYQASRRFNIEIEVGSQLYQQDAGNSNQLLFYAGYRYDF